MDNSQIVNPHGHPVGHGSESRISPLSATSRWIIGGLITAIIFMFGQISAMERRVDSKYVTRTEYEANHAQINERFNDVRNDLRSMRSLLDVILQEIRYRHPEQ